MTDIPEPSAQSAQAPPPPPPPWAHGFTTRYGLVRPRNGRYLAGVCAAIARATNTDPVLWRVLLAVLGFFFGIGILVYVAAWLVIPAEGDTASPVEALLGKGRSSMSPVTVILLSVAVVVLFGFIVTDGFRALLLGAAILIAGALLLNRNSNATGGAPGYPPGFTPGFSPGGAPVAGGVPAGYPAPGYPSAPTAGPGGFPPAAGPGYPPAAGPGYPPPYGPAGPPPPSGPTDTAEFPATGAVAAGAPDDRVTARVPGTDEPTAVPPYPPGPYLDPTPPGGYRPPFAPRGPYGGPPPPPVPPPAPLRPKPPKPPKERSALGAATFSLIPVVIGLVAIADLTNLFTVKPSTYFAAVLLVIALGLLVGTWLGRARWLIFIGLAMAMAVGISTIAEHQASLDGNRGADVVWQPATIEGVRDDYRFPFGDATLDLTRVDFTGQNKVVSVNVNAGELTVLLPSDVDVAARVDVDAGDARVLGQRVSGFGQPAIEVTDLGDDGAGGGNLRLLIHVNTGDVEVTR